VFAPAGGGRHPATVILYGTFGLLPEYRDDILSFGEALAAEGLIAFLPHYFDRTNTAPGPEAIAAIGQHYAAWLRTCGDALLFARGHARADAGRMGVLGFSLGGHFALSLAMTPPVGVSLKGAVDFFGPVVRPPLAGNRAAMPPVLIHHGEQDDLVDIGDSRRLVSELRAAGKTEGVGYTLLTYRDQGHSFAGADLVAARATTVEFLASIL
jgi:dienelactone hydrolase